MSILLPEGGYGCVFTPNITWKGNLDCSQKTITKLQSNGDITKNEIMISKNIKTIHNFNNFFSPILNSCPIQFKELNKSSVKECDTIQDNNNNLILMEQTFIKGETLDNSFINKTSKNGLKQILDSYNYLLKTIQILTQKNIVHYDIKSGNIMYNDEKNIPILINFGLSISISNLTEENYSKHFYVYAPEYYLWCPEIHYINYLLHINKNPSLDEIKNIASNYISGFKGLNMYSVSFKNEYKNSIVDFLKQFIGKSHTFVIQELLLYFNKWDNFSLSAMYLRILEFINKDGFTNNSFLLYFYELLTTNIHPNPEKRKSLKETSQIFSSLLINKNIDSKYDFSNIIQEITSNKQHIKNNLQKNKTYLSILQKSFKH